MDRWMNEVAASLHARQPKIVGVWAEFRPSPAQHPSITVTVDTTTATVASVVHSYQDIIPRARDLVALVRDHRFVVRHTRSKGLEPTIDAPRDDDGRVAHG